MLLFSLSEMLLTEWNHPCKRLSRCLIIYIGQKTGFCRTEKLQMARSEFLLKQLDRTTQTIFM